MDNLREQLQAAETRVRELRHERIRAKKLADNAKAVYAEGQTETAMRNAQAVVEALRDVESRLEQATEEQTRLLGRLADAERGIAGWSRPGVNGYAEIGRKLNLERGVNTVAVNAASLLRAQVPGPAPMSLREAQNVPATGSTAPTGPFYAYQAFPRADTAGNVAVTDFTISFTEATVSGMERDVDEVTDKQTLAGSYALATPDVRQHAIVAENVPLKLLSTAAFPAFLDTELRRQVDLSVDRAVVAAITASSPPSGSSGSDLISKLRNGIADSRSYGAWPTVLLVSVNDSSSLDLTTVGADDMYLFLPRDTGSSSPLWGLRVIESPAVSNPVLVDARAAVLYTGTASATVDDLSGLKQNTARIRTEAEVLLHVRCAEMLYVIA